MTRNATSKPCLEPDTLRGVQALQGLVPRNVAGALTVAGSGLSDHPILRVMRQQFAGTQVDDTVLHAQQVMISIKIVSRHGHHLFEMHEDVAASAGRAEGACFLHEGLIACRQCSLLPVFCDDANAVDCPSFAYKLPDALFREVGHPAESCHICEAVTYLLGHMQCHDACTVSRFAQP